MLRRNVVHDEQRLSPHLLVTAVEQSHRPVAAAQEAPRPERVDCHCDRLAQIRRVPIALWQGAC